MASMSGTIKRLVRDKGFGFISAGGQEEYFFHSSACEGMRFDAGSRSLDFVSTTVRGLTRAASPACVRRASFPDSS